VITKISGQLLTLTNETATLSIPPFEYEVSIPEYTRRHLQMEVGKSIALHTIHYIEGNAAQGSRLSGTFLNCFVRSMALAQRKRYERWFVQSRIRPS
jgi:hypothetical protein